VLNVADAERAGLRLNRGLNKVRLGPARRFYLPGALLELDVATADDGEQQVHPRRQFVPAFVPASGTAVEDFVVILFGLLDETFETDVAADFVAVLVKRQQCEQTRDATIAVAERMNAEKVEDQRGDGDERRNVVLIQRVTVEQAEFVHGGGGLLRRNAFETDGRRSAGPKFDHFVVNAFESSGVAAGRLAEGMMVFKRSAWSLGSQ